MGLLEQARADIKQITGNTDEFAVNATFRAPAPGNQTMTIPVIHTKHHLGQDSEGRPKNTKNAHISFSESAVPAEYPIRNTTGEVSLHGHQVTVKDSTGTDKQYMIREWFPDETLGLIVCIMGDFE
jgi:hypothetical protein